MKRQISAHSQPTGLTLHRADGLLDAVLRQADSPASGILCDADGLDWKEAVNLFRRMKAPGAVVLLTRLADERLWVETLDAGAFDLLEKPYRPEALCWVVSTAPQAPHGTSRQQRGIRAPSDCSGNYAEAPHSGGDALRDCRYRARRLFLTRLARSLAFLRFGLEIRKVPLPMFFACQVLLGS